MPVIDAICVSSERGPKKPIDSVDVRVDFGIEGDAHAKAGSERQVSFLSKELIETVRNEGLAVEYGAFGENFITAGFDIAKIMIGDEIVFDSGVHVKVTIIGKHCPAPCIIYKTLGRCIMPEYGIFAHVLHGGTVKTGDAFRVERQGVIVN